MQYFSIGKLSEKTGCKIPTIRFYEQEGLLPKAFRTEGNQRRYTVLHFKRLTFILHARELGFGLEDIRELIRLSLEDTESHHADEIAAKQLQAVESKIERLQSLKGALLDMMKGCKGREYESCHVIDVLSDHALCKADHRKMNP